MSSIGGPIDASSFAGAAGAADQAGRAKAKKEREKAENTRRFEDALDLKVAGVEAPEAIKKEGEDERDHLGEDPSEHHHDPGDPEEPGAHIDVCG